MRLERCCCMFLWCTIIATRTTRAWLTTVFPTTAVLGSSRGRCCPNSLSMTYKQDNDSKDEEPLFFDDFVDYSLSSESSSSSSSFVSSSLLLLQERLMQLKQEESRIQLQIQQNWQRGDWMVRGISLDISSNAPILLLDDDVEFDDDMDTTPETTGAGGGGGGGRRRLYSGQKVGNRTTSTATTTTTTMNNNNDPTNELLPPMPPATSSSSSLSPIHISKCVIQSRDENDDDDDRAWIWLGRTDGSLVAVTWSDKEPWARFVTRVVPRPMPHGQFIIQPSLVKEPTIHGPSTSDDSSHQQQPSSHDDDGFEIAAQVLQQIPEAAPISHILPLNHQSHMVLTSTQTGKGDIQSWLIPEQRSTSTTTTTIRSSSEQQQQQQLSSAFLIPTQTWKGVHTQPLVALHEYKSAGGIVCSVSQDASLAFWSVAGGDLTATAQLPNHIILSCAYLTDDYLYFGTTTGQILIYTWTQILEQATSSTTTTQQQQPQQQPCPLTTPPVGQISVSKDGSAVTAITIVTTTTTSTKDKATFLAAGTAKGIVKQWQLFTQSGTSTTTIQAWPKLETQRLPGKAHIFPHVVSSAGSDSSRIVDVQYLNNNNKDDGMLVLLTATNDSIVFWNTATAQPWHSLEGFESLTGVAMVPSAAAFCTNGMNNVMCIHDYSHVSSQNDDKFDVSQFLEFDSDDDDQD